MSKEELRRLIEAELEAIPLVHMRGLAFYLLDHLPESFWLAPASSSGKYHPPDERGPGGTALHTARVIRLALEMAEIENLDDESRSILGVAALLHDAYKGGDGDTPREHTWSLHQVAPRFLLKKPMQEATYGGELRVADNYPPEVYEQILESIFRAIEAHEGRWSKLTVAQNPSYAGAVGRILHYADYVASRDYVTVHLKGEEQGEESS